MLRAGGVSSLLCWVEGQAVCSEEHSAEWPSCPYMLGASDILGTWPSTAAEGSQTQAHLPGVPVGRASFPLPRADPPGALACGAL